MIPSGIVPSGQNSIAAIIRVVVRDANGVEAISGNNVTIANAQITSITPNHGPITGNTVVDIAGQGFDPQVNVKFGTVDGTITQTSAMLIKVKTPAVSTAGTVDVKVKNPMVPGVTGVFTYDPLAMPTITSITPNRGPITGTTEVSIAGTNFDPQVNVKFGELDAVITQKSATLIKVNSPAVATPGPVQLKVKNPGVEGATATFTYDPLPLPMIGNVDPVHGPITGNTPVTITGSNFDPQVNVKFGELDGVITQKSATQIKVNSPAVATPGAVQLKVKNPGVEGSTATFTYDPPASPVISNVDPVHGPITGNTPVTITGSNFDPQVNVKFGELDAVITQKSATLIKVNSPAVATPGAVQLKVKNPNVAAVTATFTYDPLPRPMISNVDPVHGPITGNTPVTITGTNFDPQVNVKFGELDVVITQKSATQIKVNSPAVTTPGAVQLKVKNPNVDAATASFTYDPLPPPAAPRIDGINPVVGPATRSIPVVITGANFVNGCEVFFGGTNARSVTFNSASQLTVETPTGVSPGRVRVKVVNPDQTSGKRDDGFEFIAPPVLIGIDPPEGPRAGNITVKILGMNFQSGATVRFGNTPSVDTPVVNAEGTSITCLLPPGEKGSVTVKVDNPAPDLQQGKLDNGFLYLGPQQEQAARIFSISPKTILLNTETMMTVKGRNLQKAMDQGTFAVRGPNQDFAKIEIRDWNVMPAPGAQEDVVTFFLTIRRNELSLTQRVPYYVVASVRPESKDDRIFETSRNGQFILVTNSSPVIFGVTAQLIEGAANLILLSGRNLKGSTIALTDKTGTAIPVSNVTERDDLLVAGLTLDDNLTQGTNTTASLTLMGPGQSQVGDSIPIDIMPAGPTDGDNDMPGVGQLKPAPKQQVVTVPEQNVGLFAFASSGSEGTWLPGSPVFAAPFVDYAPIPITIADFAIELVSDSIVVPAFGRSGKPQVGVVAQVRGVPLIIHLEITLFVTIRVFAFQQGNPFPSTSIGEFNEFPDSIGSAFGTYLAFVFVSTRELEAGFVIALVRPNDQLFLLVSGGLNFQFSPDQKRLMIGSIMLGAHINSIRPLTGANNLLLAAPDPDTRAAPINDLASFQAFFFPTDVGRACVDWEFNVQFTNQFLDGTPVDPDGQLDNRFVVRFCTKVVPFPGELLRLRIEPDSIVLNDGDSATATAVDMNGNPSPVPVTFKLDSSGQAVAALGSRTSNSVQVIAGQNVSGLGQLSASVTPPAGFGLFPSPDLLFSFSAATGVAVEFDSAMITVGDAAPEASLSIEKPARSDTPYCEDIIPCKATVNGAPDEVLKDVKWSRLILNLVNPCATDGTGIKGDSEKEFGSGATTTYQFAEYDEGAGTKNSVYDISLTARREGIKPASVQLRCRGADGKLKCRAWDNRLKTGDAARLARIIAVEGLGTDPIERRQIGYAVVNRFRFGKCFPGFGSMDAALKSVENDEKKFAATRFTQFDPDMGSGPKDCTECLQYQDVTAAAMEVIDDKESKKEYMAKNFPADNAQPAHAIYFFVYRTLPVPENDPNLPNSILVIPQGTEIKGGTVVNGVKPKFCQTYRRPKPRVNVTAPALKKDGTQLKVETCSTLTIGWQNVGGFYQLVQLSIDGGRTYAIDIDRREGCNPAFQFGWVVPPDVVPKGKTSVDARIRVQNQLPGHAEFAEGLSAPFTIVVPELKVKVTVPNGGQTVKVGDKFKIQWTRSGISAQAIEVSTNGGRTFTSIVKTPTLPVCASDYEWTVPASLIPAGSNSVSAIIRVIVTDANGNSVNDVSDRPFTIISGT
jgi:hypothetical protein